MQSQFICYNFIHPKIFFFNLSSLFLRPQFLSLCSFKFCMCCHNTDGEKRPGVYFYIILLHEIPIKEHVMHMLIKQHTHSKYIMFTTLLHFNKQKYRSKKVLIMERENKQSHAGELKETPKTFDFSCQLKPTTQYFHPHTVNKSKKKKRKKNSDHVRSHTPGIAASEWFFFLNHRLWFIPVRFFSCNTQGDY